MNGFVVGMTLPRNAPSHQSSGIAVIGFLLDLPGQRHHLKVSSGSTIRRLKKLVLALQIDKLRLFVGHHENDVVFLNHPLLIILLGLRADDL